MTTEAQPDNAFAWLADFQRSSSVDSPGLHDEKTRWRIGSLSFWKSEAFKLLHHDARPFPSYRRASLEWDLLPDMRVEAAPFTTNDGRRAIAILLRSEKDPEGTFGTFTHDENEAQRIIALLNSEMDAARNVATERFRASGGDPGAVASQRAPSPDEMSTILAGLFGNPDDRPDRPDDNDSPTTADRAR